MKIRITDYIADFIFKKGVKHVFMVSGGGMMFLSDGLFLHPQLKTVCNHHEQASAMAAVAYAKYNNNLGVIFVTTGCGGVNSLTGLLNAWQDNVPCLFISGQVKKDFTTRNSGLKLRQFGVQEFDIISAVKSFTKYAVTIEDPEKIAYELEKSIYLAKSGRPGPVWLDIPMDIQNAIIHTTKIQKFKIPKQKNKINKLNELLSEAKRPIVVVGQGVRLSDAKDELIKFIERYKIPVVSPFLGVGVIPTNHRFFIGRLGAKGDRPGNFAIQNSDFVLVLGSRLSVSTVGYNYSHFAREAKIVVVDIDKTEHKKKGCKINLFIHSDIKNFLINFKPKNLKFDSEWVKKCKLWKEKWPTVLSSYYVENGKVNLYYFIDCLSKNLKKDSVVISDAGSAFYVTTQAIQLKDKQRYITSGGQAEMGFTLPAAIGVSIAKNHGEVLGITGDGSFQMNIQELQTIKYNKLPIKIFVWNNDGYLSIRASQSKFFNGRFIGTDSTSGLSFPNLKKIASAYEIKYYIIKNNKEVSGVMKKVLKEKGPIICEVICLRDQEIMPTISSTVSKDGKISSNPLEDMYPFLSREELKKEMIIKPSDNS